MKKETAECLLRAADAEVQRLGFNNWHAAMESAADTLRKLADFLPDRPRAEMESIAEALRKLADLLPRLEQLLSDAPEPTPDGLEQLLQMIEKMGPSVFRKEAVKLIRQEIPHDPGGRPSVLGSAQDQARRVGQVLALIGKKVKTTDALKRVAQKEDISLSSMHRIWRKRGEQVVSDGAESDASHRS